MKEPEEIEVSINQIRWFKLVLVFFSFYSICLAFPELVLSLSAIVFKGVKCETLAKMLLFTYCFYINWNITVNKIFRFFTYNLINRMCTKLDGTYGKQSQILSLLDTKNNFTSIPIMEQKKQYFNIQYVSTMYSNLFC